MCSMKNEFDKLRTDKISCHHKDKEKRETEELECLQRFKDGKKKPDSNPEKKESDEPGEKQSAVYLMLMELLEKYSFINIRRKELYLYIEAHGYWKLILPNEADIVLRELLTTNWIRSINSASITELYKWLLIETDPCKPSNFLKGRDCLNFIDVAYDWKKEKFVKDRKNLYFTYAINMKCPMEKESTRAFEKFIDDVFGDDKDTKKEFSKFVGLCLSDIRDLKYVFFLFGPSDTGKTTMMNAIKHAVGVENCCSLSFSQLSNEFYVSALYGKRLNVSGEISGMSTTKLDVLKSLSGNDDNLASYKFKDAFSFRNTCLLAFACNVFPKVDFMDMQSFANRMIIFPFRNVIERCDWNENLQKDLQKDAKGIISFAIKGLRRLDRDNYQIIETPEMQQCKNDYAGMYDSFTLFCNEYIKPAYGESATSAEIHAAYSKFCQMNEYELLKDNQWAQILKRRYGCAAATLYVSDGNGGKRRQRGYKGIVLKKKTAELFEEESPKKTVTIQQMMENN